MTTAAVLPIKRFAMAKQRLERDDRAGLMRDMAARVLDAVCGAALDAVYVVTADAEAAEMAQRHGAEVVEEPDLLGHSAAASLGVRRAIERGAERVLLVAGDCPLLRSADIDALLAAHRGPGVVVLPDRHGTGTNALLLSPPDAIAPSFGPGSRERHVARAVAAGMACAVDERTPFALDVDTADDLAAVRAAQR